MQKWWDPIKYRTIGVEALPDTVECSWWPFKRNPYQRSTWEMDEWSCFLAIGRNWMAKPTRITRHDWSKERTKKDNISESSKCDRANPEVRGLLNLEETFKIHQKLQITWFSRKTTCLSRAIEICRWRRLLGYIASNLHVRLQKGELASLTPFIYGNSMVKVRGRW